MAVKVIRWKIISGLLVVVAQLAACRQQMADQPRYDPLEASSFFADGQSARAPVEGTVARGQLQEDAQLFNGGTDTVLASEFPIPVTIEMLRRGQERYNIYCTPCHDRTGSGNGMIVRRGYARPPSYHTEILRRQPVGHLFRVISRGLGAMPSYSAQISAADRWAIIAYIRSLQLSQNAALADVPAEQRGQIDEQK
jgi:mono/diheme cytochrome c family protein